MKRLAPYPVLVGDVVLDVRQARVDDLALNLSMISTAQRAIALHTVERAEWETARFSVRMNAPQAELTAGPWSNVVCLAVLAERRTNTRTVTRLLEDGPGTWAGEVMLNRDLHVGRAELTGQLVATVHGVGGRAIGATDEAWVIDLKERTPARDKSVKTVWADFGDERNPHLHAFRGDPWTVEAVGEEPTLYLNRAFDGLESLLRSGRGADKAARDAIASQIATDVWSSLFNAAVYTAQIDDGRVEWPGGWQEVTLRRMLPDVFPDRSADDALAEIANRRLSGDGGGDLQTRMLHAVAKQAKLPRNLGGLIRVVRRIGQEDE
jgi:hypothetical protein